MKTLTICLLVFCVVAVSSKPWMFDYVKQKHPHWIGTHEWQDEVTDEVTDEVSKIKDNIVPPEIEVTPIHEIMDRELIPTEIPEDSVTR